jgi:hypothetical protein
MKAWSEYSLADGRLTTQQVHGQDAPDSTATHAWVEGAHDAAVWSVAPATGELVAVPSIALAPKPTELQPT